ncbi:MAG: RNA polymerase subunit sigma-70 [Gammaproteobacteria bacterium]|nr:MAG: RNA polymerase subunit sigma-70 [Gammaproteobacteria bacterium]
MKSSRRTQRMSRHHKRNATKATISLVSLMDIFTILVFFLLVNSSNTQQLPKSESIALPTSTSEQLPKDNLVLMVNGDEILVQGRVVVTAKEALASDEDIIVALKKELDYRASRQRSKTGAEDQGRPITIMGDKDIPYQLLKKIMLTCSKANFSQISLAVRRKAGDKSV